MSTFTTEPNLEKPDDFYAALLEVHDGLSREESEAFNARLILVLANQIGNEAVLTAALRAAQSAPSDI